MPDPNAARPEAGTCPLCRRHVAGGRFPATDFEPEQWLPARGAAHAPDCPNFHDGSARAVAPAFNISFASSEQRHASRHVSARVYFDNAYGPPLEMYLSVSATQFEDQPWPEPRFCPSGSVQLTAGQFAALGDAVRQLFAAYRERFGG